MKRYITLILALIIGNSLMGQSIPNQDFENWTQPYPLSNIEEPEDWVTSNGFTFQGTIDSILVEKTKDSYSGTYASRWKTKKDTPAIGFIGGVDVVAGSINFGTNYSNSPTHFEGYFKYFPALYDSITPDTAVITVNLTSWNEDLQQTEGVAQTAIEITDTTDTYTEFSTKLNYVGCTPDTVQIFVTNSTSQDSTLVGTTLFLDSLHFRHNNYFPTARPDTFYINNTNDPVTVHVTANDTDRDGDNIYLSSSLYASPKGGTATVLNNDSIRYTPNPNTCFTYNTDTLTYQVTDSVRNVSCARGNVIIHYKNKLPQPVNDTAYIAPDAPSVVVNATGNDIDPDGDNIYLGDSISAGPAYGNAKILNEDSIIYYPDTSFETSDTLTYSITDSTRSNKACRKGQIFIQVDSSLSTSAPDSYSPHFTIYPNPASEVVHIKTMGTFSHQYNLKLYNNQGRLVKQAVIQQPHNSISTHQLPAGLYFYRITSGETSSEYKSGKIQIYH